VDGVAILSQLRSVLGLEERDLVQFGTEYYRIRGAVCSEAGEEGTLELTSQIMPRKKKGFFINDVKVPAAELVGRLPTVVFLPQDLELFRGPPLHRRRFLDDILLQVSPAYYNALMEYQKLLKQRNALLKRIAAGGAAERELDPWDRGLAEKGSLVTVSRLELMETFSLTLDEELRTLGEAWGEVRLHYGRSGTAREADALAEELEGLLGAAREKDILLQSTSVGPHRDDWDILVEGHSLAHVASRGQQRAAVLALLFLEASYMELRRGERPVIILDDILSELDDMHRQRVVEAFPRHQVLLTSTHLPPAVNDAVVWKVVDGGVKRQ